MYVFPIRFKEDYAWDGGGGYDGVYRTRALTQTLTHTHTPFNLRFLKDIAFFLFLFFLLSPSLTDSDT